MNRSENMSRIRSKDTKPELTVRRLLYSLGYRYRLHRQDLPGKPDIVFSGRRKVIFVHGCFWHGHGCKRGHTPRSNKVYWSPKLQRNAARDAVARAALSEQGWDNLVIWECETTNEDLLAETLRRFLSTA